MSQEFAIVSGGAIGLTAATAKTVAGIKAATNDIITLVKVEVSFDGVTASAVPVLIEVGTSTFATNAPGTASTSVTPASTRGRQATAMATAAKTWTTEPTVMVVLEEFLLTPNGGTYIADGVPAREIESPISGGLVVRLTAPAAVNVRFCVWFAE